jgi:hypothetical protein
MFIRCSRGVGFAACAPGARGTRFLCRWPASPANCGRRIGSAVSGPTPRLRSARVAPISTREGEGRDSFARLALTRVPLVAPLGLELGILGEKPQALEGSGRFKCPSRSAICHAPFNSNTGINSVVARHRSGPCICVGGGATNTLRNMAITARFTLKSSRYFCG